jgi:hypothetical protein
MPEQITDIAELARLRKIHNPNNQPTGHFTGRCFNCGSTNLWTDETAYGCNVCHALFMTGNISPRAICNFCKQSFELGEFHECAVFAFS